MEQEHRPTAAVVFHMNRNAVDLHNFAFPLLLCHHMEQLFTRRRGRRHRLVGRGDLHDTVDHSRSAMTSCGNASIDLSSVEARKRSASYVVATRSALAMAQASPAAAVQADPRLMR
jgi:hypothetical protein